MQLISLNLLHKDSFVEFFVTKFDFCQQDKVITIVTNGCDLDDDEGALLKKVKLKISLWSTLNVIEIRNGIRQKLSNYPDHFMNSIIEFNFKDNELKLVGLGYNCWVEWVFTDANIIIYGEF